MPIESPLQREIAEIIVDALNLEVGVDEIEPNEPLFYEGLGLDSIDALELSLALSKRYGFQIKSDDPDNKDIFASLASLAVVVDQRRTD